MRKSKFAVAIGAAIALAAVPLMTATSASASANNSGGASVTGETSVPGVNTESAKFKKYNEPTGKYTSKSCAADLSGIADFTIVTEIDDCGTTITVSPGGDKRTVGQSWATWGSPPATEDPFPHILYTGGTSFTLDLGGKSKTGGVEVEPDPFAVHSFTVTFYKGENGTGKVAGSITRDANGEAGAVLFGGKAKKGFKSIVVTSNDGVGFAIAQIRS